MRIARERHNTALGVKIMKLSFPTPHIAAKPNDFAKTVLMPGDPNRALFIAKNFLTGAVAVNNVRGVQGHTGYFGKTRVTVMASGMGMPSMGIYSYELYNAFGVQNILRIGSAGAYDESLNLRDIVIGMGACTDSDFAKQYRLPGTFAPICSFNLLQQCVAAAKAQNLPVRVGNLLSSDVFYKDDADLPENQTAARLWQRMGVLAVEMEAAALYMNAARCGKNALAICSVSDHLFKKQELTAAERETSFTNMITLALYTAERLEQGEQP